MLDDRVVAAEIVCPSPPATIAAGRRIGERLKPGDVVLLSGDLGAGKTTLAQGIVAGYGIAEPVTSPSFALIHEYRSGPRLVVHFDPYRLENPDTLDDTGWEEYLDGQAVMLIEWPERLGKRTPMPHVLVSITTADDASRSLVLRCAARDVARWRDVWTC